MSPASRSPETSEFSQFLTAVDESLRATDERIAKARADRQDFRQKHEGRIQAAINSRRSKRAILLPLTRFARHSNGETYRNGAHSRTIAAEQSEQLSGVHLPEGF